MGQTPSPVSTRAWYFAWLHLHEEGHEFRYPLSAILPLHLDQARRKLSNPQSGSQARPVIGSWDPRSPTDEVEVCEPKVARSLLPPAPSRIPNRSPPA
jgi:hypothetical protein